MLPWNSHSWFHAVFYLYNLFCCCCCCSFSDSQPKYNFIFQFYSYNDDSFEFCLYLPIFSWNVLHDNLWFLSERVRNDDRSLLSTCKGISNYLHRHIFCVCVLFTFRIEHSGSGSFIVCCLCVGKQFSCVFFWLLPRFGFGDFFLILLFVHLRISSVTWRVFIWLLKKAWPLKETLKNLNNQNRYYWNAIYLFFFSCFFFLVFVEIKFLLRFLTSATFINHLKLGAEKKNISISLPTLIFGPFLKGKNAFNWIK